MNTITWPYKIYPAWFGGAAFGPINEMAMIAATNMGRLVLDIEAVNHGEDQRGPYFTFTVTYSSTSALRARRS